MTYGFGWPIIEKDGIHLLCSQCFLPSGGLQYGFCHPLRVPGRRQHLLLPNALPDISEGQILLHLLIGKVCEYVPWKRLGLELTTRKGIFGPTPLQTGHCEAVPEMKCLSKHRAKRVGSLSGEVFRR